MSVWSHAGTTVEPTLFTVLPSKNIVKSFTPSIPPPVFSTTLVMVTVVATNVLVMVHSSVSPIPTVIVP